MIHQYHPGDTAYIVQSAVSIREVLIHNISGDFYTLRFTDSNGGIKVRGSRLFPTREAAETTLPNTLSKTHTRSPHPHLDEARISKCRKHKQSKLTETKENMKTAG